MGFEALGGRAAADRAKWGDRLPPGQHEAKRWPVLHRGQAPEINFAGWQITIDGEVEAPVTLDGDRFLALPQTETVSDIHCVTRWSLFDQHWKGMTPPALLAPARPTANARYALIEGHGGYTANLPLDVFYADGVLFAYEHEGEPLSTEHGGPVRLVVPQRYLWKSVKWVERVTLLREDRPGTWEQLAYHNEGDPWREERYRGAPPGGRS